MKRTFRGGLVLLLGLPVAVAVLIPSADADSIGAGRAATAHERDLIAGEALAEIGDTFRSQGPGAWSGTVVFSDGRRQKVSISTDAYAFAVGQDTARARRIDATVLLAPDGVRAETVHKLMSEHDGAGSFRIESSDRGERLVYSAVVPDTMDAGQFSRAVKAAALVADETEAVLAGGRDRF